MRTEYDFSSLSGAVRGKYYQRFRAGVNLRLLEPEVAEAFPTSESVNTALRAVMVRRRSTRRRIGASRSRNHLRRTKPAQAKKPHR